MNIATKFTPNKIPTKDVSLEDKYLSDDGTAYMTGIQAMVRLPLAQTRRDTLNGYHTAGFISGYRGSLSEIMIIFSGKLKAYSKTIMLFFNPV
jgi:indolepyruvate ferredoxin oxidoreductase